MNKSYYKALFKKCFNLWIKFYFRHLNDLKSFFKMKIVVCGITFIYSTFDKLSDSYLDFPNQTQIISFTMYVRFVTHFSEDINKFHTKKLLK